MIAPTVSVVRVGGVADPAADSAADLVGDWIVFDWDATLPAQADLARLSAAAGDAELVVAVPGRRRQGAVDLEREPDALRVAGAVLLFRGRILREHGLRPDRDLPADLSALLLTARYLLAAPRPSVLLTRQPGPQWTAVGSTGPERYSPAAQRFAELLVKAHTQRGSVPRWLQNLWLRQVFADLREGSRFASTTPPAAAIDAFHAALALALQHIDEQAIAELRCPDATDETRAALLLKTRHAHTRPVRHPDPGRGLARFSYYFSGAAPAETITGEGAALLPEHHKIRSVQLLGATLMSERIVWIPDGAELRVDSGDEIVLPRPGPVSRSARYRRILAEDSGLARTVARDLRIRRRAGSARAQQRYRGAWLLMDRDTAAQDNAEHLYRYLMRARPDVNAWFVLSRDSPDWTRLERDGFRLIDYGSQEYFIALLNCAHLVSSQVDDYVSRPFRRHLLGEPRWRFTFLQHGVLAHDLSRWLNRKQIDCFVTSAPFEYDAIVGDHTPYVFTDLEVRLVGLARHDRLLRLAQQSAPRRLLVMPTWRPHLLGEPGLGNARPLLAGFWESGYARAWRGLLSDESLRSLCAAHGWQLTLVMHPNMQGYLDGADLPDHVDALRFSDIDVQAVIAESAVLVTDYSSLASEAAYIRRPVVYYQFDRDEFFGGFRRPGSWSYEQDGFGPVTETAEGTVAALERIAEAGGPEPAYAERIERGFPLRDGQCCERTVAAIEAITSTGRPPTANAGPRP